MDVREQDTIVDIKSARAFFWGTKYVLYLCASISSGEENWDGSEKRKERDEKSRSSCFREKKEKREAQWRTAHCALNNSQTEESRR